MGQGGSVETFEAIGDRYDSWHGSVGGRVQQTMVLGEVGDLAGRTVLDVGCGTGYYCRLFAASGARRVLGVDLSEAMITYARSVPIDGVVEYRVGDALAELYSERFDLVTALWLVNHAESPAQLSAMLRGFLECSDELVLLTTNSSADWTFLGDRAREYGLRAFRNGPAVDGRTPYVCTVYGSDDEATFQSGSWALPVLTSGLYEAGYSTVRLVEPIALGPAELLASLPFMILRASR